MKDKQNISLLKISELKILLLIFIPMTCLSFSNAQTSTIDTLFQSLEQLEQYLFYRHHDTSYIRGYNDKIGIKLVANSKYNHFQQYDSETNSSLYYRPNRGVNIGFGISHRWFAVDLVFNSRFKENSGLSDKKHIDFQGRIFSSKHFIEGTLQYYQNYKMGRMNGFVLDSKLSDEVREDIRTINFGIQYLYVFNYDKFSLKAPFVMSEIQRKSAGSIITGASYNMFVMDADSSTIPEGADENFNPVLSYTDLNSLNLSFKLGYIYSFVLKEHFFLTLGVIPGLNINYGDYYLQERVNLQPHIAVNFKGISSIGYNGDRVFSGVQLFYEHYNIRLEKTARTRVGQGKLAFYIGYRFNVGSK